MPRAGDAFLSGALPISHDPLARIDTQKNKPVFDLEAFIESLKAMITDYMIPIIKDLTGVDLSILMSLINPMFALLESIAAALDGIQLVTGAVVGTIQSKVSDLIHDLIQPIIDAIIAAFTGSHNIGNDVTGVISALLNPLQLFNNALHFIEDIASQLGGQSGGLDARLSALEANALGAKGLVSADNFNRATIGSTWTNVVGTLAIRESAYVRTPSGRSAGYYNVDEPDTDKHGAAIKLVKQLAGDCRFFICSDAAMTNYAAVEIHCGIFGDDYLRLVTGSSPTLVVTHKQKNYGGGKLNSNDVINLKYDDTINTFYVQRNGVIVDGLTWEDTDNIVTHGATQRKVGIVSNSLNQSAFPGFGITDFVYYDW